MASAASAASVASSQPDGRHLRMIAAAAQGNEGRIREILGEDTAWTSATDRDALRQSLQKVATRGNLALARLLLEHGADPNVRREGDTPALFPAAAGGHAAVVAALLAHGADANWRNRHGQTALFVACMRGRDGVVRALLDDGGASVDARDKEGRTALLYLAAEKKAPRTETLRMLLQRDADLEARDGIGRTALLWAATNGNVALVAALLSGELGKTADVAAANNRGRTALHLASESEHGEEMVGLLVRHGADARAVSDGGWTALHNAAQSGHAGTVALLLAAGAGVNAELSNGMTPLHWAAFNGHEAVVRQLLARPETSIAVRDGFDRTPMLCAAERRHKAIVQLLSPARAAGRLGDAAARACRAFEATVVDFGNFRDGKKQLVFKHSVHDLLYGWDDDEDDARRRPTVSTVPANIRYQPAFRWIHLPANNIAWVETLLAKNFVESGHRDIDAFKALEKTFDQEHRGQFAHAHFMRTFSQRVPAAEMAPRGGRDGDAEDRPLIAVAEEQSDMSTASQATLVAGGKSEAGGGGGGGGGGGKKKSKAEQIAERHPKRARRSNGPPGNPPGTKLAAKIAAGQLPFEATRQVSCNGRLVLFMPFLHYETNERRQKMSAAIRSARSGLGLPAQPTRDELLTQAYATAMPPLHPRRTLDQYFYHGIDTSARDTDQVVYRYCRRNGLEPKVFMVDQLWLWVLGKDLVVTCFPQRWDQPKHDPLNVLDGILEWTNAKTRPPVQSAYELAMTVTSRCSGMFDRHRLDDSDYQFLDMFESSIGHVTDRESQLFDRFNRASRLSGQWLQHHRHPQRGVKLSTDRLLGGDDPIFPDVLLDIGVETSLLAEIKDIRDELNIIAVILASQTSILDEFEGHVTDELRSPCPSPSSSSSASTHTHTSASSTSSSSGTSAAAAEALHRRAAEPIIAEIRRRAREQARLLDVHRKDLSRMDRQAESIYTSLTHLLDLKQKHSNALEARFARDQAVIAARQGQTVMVFTIVTIIFLPISFIASFFAINFEEWTGAGLTIPYVSKYLFGIGLAVSVPLIAMAFTVSDIADAAGRGAGGLVRWVGRVGKGREEEEEEEHGGRKDRDKDGPPEDETGVYSKLDGGARFRGRRSLAEGREPDWPGEKGDAADGPPRSPLSRLGARLPVRARHLSFGSGGSGWRPSFDRERARERERERERAREDLERGRGEGWPGTGGGS